MLIHCHIECKLNELHALQQASAIALLANPILCGTLSFFLFVGKIRNVFV